jgi:hypothetical protein
MAEHNMTKPTVKDFSPERISFGFGTQLQEASCVDRNEPSALQQLQPTLGLTRQSSGFLDCLSRELHHVTRDTAVNDQYAVFRDPVERHSRVQEGHVFLRQGFRDLSQYGGPSSLLFSNLRPQRLIPTEPTVLVLVVAFNQHDLERPSFSHLPRHANHSNGIRSLVHQVTDENDRIPRLGVQSLHQLTQLIGHAVNVAYEQSAGH